MYKYISMLEKDGQTLFVVQSQIDQNSLEQAMNFTELVAYRQQKEMAKLAEQYMEESNNA